VLTVTDKRPPTPSEQQRMLRSFELRLAQLEQISGEAEQDAVEERSAGRAGNEGQG